MIKKSFLLLVLIILLAANVSALGVTPGRIPIDFSPGLKKDLSFTVINSDHKNVYLSIQTSGDLKDSIVLAQNSISMSSNEEEKNVNFRLNLPDNLPPGMHTADIAVMQSATNSNNGQASIGAAVAVIMQVAVYVPYPGKYLDAQLSVEGDASKKIFIISAISRGTEGIDNAKAQINIYDSSGNLIKTLETGSSSIQSSEQKQLSAVWNVDSSQGKYTARAVLNYDSKEVLLQKDFNVGEFVLELQQMFVKDFTLGGIAKFNLVVQNKWNEAINGAYAEMSVYDQNVHQIADVKSATYDLSSGAQTTMNYYWDTKGISPGLYNANVVLSYAQKTTQEQLKLDVAQDKIDVIGLGYVISSQNSSGSSGLTTTLLVIIGFLILLNLAWFFILRKKKK